MGILQFGISWVVIFRGRNSPGGVWSVGIFQVGVFQGWGIIIFFFDIMSLIKVFSSEWNLWQRTNVKYCKKDVNTGNSFDKWMTYWLLVPFPSLGMKFHKRRFITAAWKLSYLTWIRRFMKEITVLSLNMRKCGPEKNIFAQLPHSVFDCDIWNLNLVHCVNQFFSLYILGTLWNQFVFAAQWRIQNPVKHRI